MFVVGGATQFVGGAASFTVNKPHSQTLQRSNETCITAPQSAVSWTVVITINHQLIDAGHYYVVYRAVHVAQSLINLAIIVKL